MINYGRIKGQVEPPEIEMTDTSVFIASNIEPYTETIDDVTINGYEYDYISYTKDEYLLQQNQSIRALQEELAAAKVLLGVE